ncbi:oxidoreductase [Streptomyces sp. 8K308]|uniref:NADH-quinone oxidoreductase subunit NuoF family protein n=1 Tax=Streptomyces sp. 8K308 TaxID=2530388 RepID=UPI001053F25C|nr:NADH-quinone oxidoreductase subunit NuoF family protein [Streptomyces sp. 8K308]TDC07792.1 oxidoreductase [Streptomyces sp. 8K308]
MSVPRRPALAVVGQPRLLAGLDVTTRLDRVAHLTVHGPLPRLRLEEVIALAENIDLRGRGGAGFPFARKLKGVVEAAGRRGMAPHVVINGSEGEPSCLKDKELLLRTPHLVLEGALLAAEALGADRVAIGVTRSDVEKSVREAVAEMPPGARPIEVTYLPERFVTGEASALTRGIEGLQALPAGRKVRSTESGLAGAPTLFSNTETFTQLSVAARIGALSYREMGLPGEPGTVLLSVAGRFVVEAPVGTPLRDVLWLCGITDPGQGVLIGGYHGRFIDADAAKETTLDRDALKRYDAMLAAGAVMPVPHETCPVGETVKVARWMADQSANQCGPCALGLPSIAEALSRAANGGGLNALDAVRDRVLSVRKRGACSHPDGTANFVNSALNSFLTEFTDHAVGRGCGRPTIGSLAVPPEPIALPAATEGGPKLLVDWTLCRGHGLCADVVPEVVRLGPDGYPDNATYNLPADSRNQAVRAIRRCPELALRLAN